MVVRDCRRLMLGLCLLLISSNVFAQAATQPSPATPKKRLAISKVSVQPKRLSALADQDVTILFTLSKPGRGLVRIFDQWGRIVRTIVLGDLDAGQHDVVWDGRDEQGKICRGHRFVYAIYTRDDQRQRAVYDPSDRGAGREIRARKLILDKTGGKVSYVLPKPAMVRIRIGLKDGPLMRTLIDWEPQLAGAHDVPWDGKDASGLMQLLNHPDLQINLSAYALPPNSILVDQDSAQLDPQNTNTLPETLEARPGSRARRHLHWSCDPSHCHEPCFTVTLPHATQSESGDVVVSGKTPIRVEVDPQDLPYLVSKEFEIVLFVDGVFLIEEENGTSPWTYYWDTKGLNPGRHFVTVNVMSYDDHIGTATHAVRIGGGQ